MSDVPSTAVSYSESIECFPGIISKYFLKHFVAILVAPITTGVIIHFRFHIRCISIHKLSYFRLLLLLFGGGGSGGSGGSGNGGVIIVSCHRPFPPGTSLEQMVIW